VKQSVVVVTTAPYTTRVAA